MRLVVARVVGTCTSAVVSGRPASRTVTSTNGLSAFTVIVLTTGTPPTVTATSTRASSGPSASTLSCATPLLWRARSSPSDAP